MLLSKAARRPSGTPTSCSPSRRRGDTSVPALTLEQISGQLAIAVARVMGEGSLYDEQLAALAIKQARGDLIEAAFLMRAYRTTLPRFGYSKPVDTAENAGRAPDLSDLQGPCRAASCWDRHFDYSHRLLDFALAAESEGGDLPVDGTRSAGRTMSHAEGHRPPEGSRV
jgi:alpha-D-ribose 1-methylphosphonate 5-triphosphate synthase subunit PhnI